VSLEATAVVTIIIITALIILVTSRSANGQLRIWDGDDLRRLHTIKTARGNALCLAVYEEPTAGTSRLVTG
jgi:hypothetical protein